MDYLVFVPQRDNISVSWFCNYWLMAIWKIDKEFKSILVLLLEFYVIEIRGSLDVHVCIMNDKRVNVLSHPVEVNINENSI